MRRRARIRSANSVLWCFVRSIVWSAVLCAPVPLHAEFLEEAARAAELIDSKRLDLARAYLDPLLIDPALSSTRRSLAYYLRGASFAAEQHYVSAARDYTRALEYNSGNVAARAALALMYDEGLGVEQNKQQAVNLSVKAARAGHVPSMFYVGNAMLTGTGVEPDIDKARFWLERAADADHIPSLLLLARSYRAPFAAEPDPAEARRLYRLAAARGSVEALAELEVLTTEEARNEAREEAAAKPGAG